MISYPVGIILMLTGAVLSQDNAFTCEQIPECWACLSSGCLFNPQTNSCTSLLGGFNVSDPTSFNTTFTSNIMECIDFPPYFGTVTECATRFQDSLESCAEDSLFSCNSQNCTGYFNCLIDAERTHDGEVCRFTSGQFERCNLNVMLIRCQFGNSFGATCDGLCGTIDTSTINASRSCEECLYSTGIAFNRECPEGCLACDDSNSDDSCYYCSNTTHLRITNSDCTGVCVPLTDTTEDAQCSFQCSDLCPGLGIPNGSPSESPQPSTSPIALPSNIPSSDSSSTSPSPSSISNTSPSPSPDSSPSPEESGCVSCLLRNGAQSDNCFQGSENHGRCVLCGFGESASESENCIVCGDGFVLDIRDETTCTGTCVRAHQAQNPYTLSSCFRNTSRTCYDQCPPDTTPEIPLVLEECARCLFRQNTVLNQSECAESAVDNCMACRRQGNNSTSCMICEGGFELDVANQDCSGNCVSPSSARNPLIRAISVEGENSCSHPCRDSCFNSEIFGVNLGQVENCMRCLDSNGFSFGQGSNCYENGPLPPPIFDPTIYDSREDFCARFNTTYGGCSVCLSSPPRTSSACLLCESGFELDVIDYFTGAGVCVPIGCAKVPYSRNSASRDTCFDHCTGTLISPGSTSTIMDQTCMLGRSDIEQLCSVTVDNVLCPMQTPTADCCVALAVYENLQCSNNLMALTNFSSSCTFLPLTTSQLLQLRCGVVDVQRVIVELTLGGENLTASLIQSSVGVSALLRAASRISLLPISQIAIQSIKNSQGKQLSVTDVMMNLLGDSTQLGGIESLMNSSSTFLNIFNEEAEEGANSANSTFPLATSAQVKGVSQLQNFSSTVNLVNVCEISYSAEDCATELQRNCFSSSLSCENFLQTSKSEAYSRVCGGNFSGYDECCSVNSGNVTSFRVTCTKPLAETNNRICTRLYRDSSCTAENGNEVCVDYLISCDTLRETQAVLSICNDFEEYGDCCTLTAGTSVVITCNEGHTSSSFAWATLFSLIFPAFIGLLLIRQH